MAKIKLEIIDEIIESFERVGGAAYLDELALRDPPTYCRLVAHVLPKAISVDARITEPIDLGKAMTEANARLAVARQTDDHS
jgi:hypothetical protein